MSDEETDIPSIDYAITLANVAAITPDIRTQRRLLGELTRLRPRNCHGTTVHRALGEIACSDHRRIEQLEAALKEERERGKRRDELLMKLQDKLEAIHGANT